jgi:hypothetical protein
VVFFCFFFPFNLKSHGILLNCAERKWKDKRQQQKTQKKPHTIKQKTKNKKQKKKIKKKKKNKKQKTKIEKKTKNKNRNKSKAKHGNTPPRQLSSFL